jgi:phage tail sheath gpL-like
MRCFKLAAPAAAAPTAPTLVSLLNNGITPIGVNSTGSTYIVKRCTSRSLSGSTADSRIRDAHKVAIMFAWATAEKNVTQQQFGGKDLLDPPATGQSPAAGQPPNVFATNYQIVGNALKDLTTKMGLAGLLQNTAVTNASAIIQREVNPRNRVSASFNLTTADILDQVCAVASQVG